MNNKATIINASIFGSIAVILSAIMWGIDGVILTPRLLNNHGLPLNSSLVVFILHLIPFAIMNMFFYKNYSLLKKFSAKDFIFMMLIAIFGGALGTMSIVKALLLVNFKNLTIVALLQKLQPIFAILLSLLILKEKLSKNFWLWSILAIISGYIMTFGFSMPISHNNNIVQAALYAFFAAFAFGASTVFSKVMLNKYSFLSITFFRYGFTTIISLLIALFLCTFPQISTIPNKTWIIFIIICFTTGSGAIFLYYYGLNKIKASLSSIYELFFPLTAAILDYYINENAMSLIQWIAAAFMVFSIIKLRTSK